MESDLAAPKFTLFNLGEARLETLKICLKAVKTEE